MLKINLNQQFEIGTQQNFRADDPSSSIDGDVQPIFVKYSLPCRFDRNTKINEFVVSNKVCILKINEKIIQRRSLENNTPENQGVNVHQDVQLNEPIKRIFLDPFGRIVLVSLKSKSEVLVLVSSTNSLKQKGRGIKFGNNASFRLSSVCWCNRFLKPSSGETVALLAGEDGSIYEVSIGPDGDTTFCNEVYPNFRSILAAKESQEKLTGILCDPKTSYADPSNVFVVLTTQKSLFYFESQIDKTKKQDFFSSFFGNYRNATLADLKYQEFPGGEYESEIQMFSIQKNNPMQTLLRQFVWITNVGLFYTEIDPEHVEDSFLKNSKIIDFFIDKTLKQRDEEKPPRSVGLTEFHSLMMFPNENQIRTVCNVNESLVSIDRSLTGEKLICFARDQISNQLWACSEESIFGYLINDERRDVWKIFMQKKQFGRARETSMIPKDLQETMRRQRIIYSRNAEFLFEQNKFVNSAQCYAKSDTSFEDATLKFFALKDKEPLREYLQAVLSSQKSEDESAQITILTLWLIDLFLNELNELRQAPFINSSLVKPKNESTSNESTIDPMRRKDSIEQLRRQFERFLKQSEIQKCLKEHKSAIYDLLTSHGDLDDLILFAEHVEDFERVILVYLERGDYQKALKTLEPLPRHDLLYKYSTNIIEKQPTLLIELWKKKYNDTFEPQRLLPAMMTYSRFYPVGKEVLSYLTFCLTRGCNDKSIHNYLLSEYVKFDRNQIINYLRDQKQELESISYDPRYALQLCIENQLKEESVFLYRLLNMHEEAVDTALEFDVKLAKECASAAQNNDERTKKLWLKIARSVINKEDNDLNKVMDLLNECGDDLLKIEDILPLFPDFETIDQFKEPIIQSLDRYNQRLNELKSDMADASKSIDKIRDDLTKYRTRCVGTVDSNALCSTCDQPLMLRSAFYVFACGHYFHDECLFSQARKLLKSKTERSTDENRFQTSTKSAQLLETSAHFAKRSTTETINNLQSTLASGISSTTRDMESVQEEIDNLIAANCVICGEIAVENIDQPLDQFI